MGKSWLGLYRPPLALLAQTHAFLKSVIVGKHLLVRHRVSTRPHQHLGMLSELPWSGELNIHVLRTTCVTDEMCLVLPTSRALLHGVAHSTPPVPESLIGNLFPKRGRRTSGILDNDEPHVPQYNVAKYSTSPRNRNRHF